MTTGKASDLLYKVSGKDRNENGPTGLVPEGGREILRGGEQRVPTGGSDLYTEGARKEKK